MRKFCPTGMNDTIFCMCISSGIHWHWLEQNRSGLSNVTFSIVQLGMFLELGPVISSHQMAVKFEVKLHVTPLKNQETISRTMVGVSKLSDFLVIRKVITRGFGSPKKLLSQGKVASSSDEKTKEVNGRELVFKG